MRSINKRRESWCVIVLLLIFGISDFISFSIFAGAAYESGGFWGSRFQDRLAVLSGGIIVFAEAIAAMKRRLRDVNSDKSNARKYVCLSWVSIATLIIFGEEIAIAYGRMVYDANTAGDKINTFDILFMIGGIISAVIGIGFGIMKLRRRKKAGN